MILAIGYGGPAVTVLPGTADVLDASTVNTTSCLRYAPDYTPGEDWAARGGDGVQTLRALPRTGYSRPPLDLSKCHAAALHVHSAVQRVLVQVRRPAGCCAAARLPRLRLCALAVLLGALGAPGRACDGRCDGAAGPNRSR